MPTKSSSAKSAAEKKSTFNSDDIKKNKEVAALSYIWILCLIPFFLKKDSPYAQFHAKQGLTILIAWVIILIIGIIPVLGWMIWFFGMIAIILISIAGVIKTLNGEAWEIPFIYDWSKKWNI